MASSTELHPTMNIASNRMTNYPLTHTLMNVLASYHDRHRLSSTYSMVMDKRLPRTRVYQRDAPFFEPQRNEDAHVPTLLLDLDTECIEEECVDIRPLIDQFRGGFAETVPSITVHAQQHRIHTRRR